MERELWFKTNKKGETTPFKLVLKNGKVLYNSKYRLFKHLRIGETINYYRIREDKSILKRTLQIDNIFLNDENILTLIGDFNDIKEK